MNRRPAIRAMTIVEVVIAMMIASGMLAAALYAVAASRKALIAGNTSLVATELADDLLGFVYALPYETPSSGSLLGGILGVVNDVISLGAVTKPSLADVDDCHNWRESPPQDASGATIPGLTGWSRHVYIDWVTLANPSVTSASETGVKRITVVVRRNNIEVARRVALRTRLSNP